MAANEYTPLRIIQTSEENAKKLINGESIISPDGEEITFGMNDAIVTTDDLEARVNEKLDGKVDKLTTAAPIYRLYGVAYNSTATQIFPCYETPAPWRIPMYTANSTLQVKTPVQGLDAANKDYVDTNIATNIAALPPAIISTTWAELKQLRDNAQLIPGHFYRITDYECTTVQYNTKSAGHRFDIIVQAVAANRLSESARADYHAGDTYFQSVSDDIIGSNITSHPGETPLTEGEVEWLYSIYEDTGSTGEAEYDNEIEEGCLKGDTFVAFDFRENNKGAVVPVLYKTDPEEYGDEADYQDCFYYVGKYSLDGVIYDRWRKIEDYADGGSPYTWDSTAKQYALTNKIVGEGLLIEGTFTYSTGDNRANLSAWELKYCLDNDDKRFAWADTTINQVYVKYLWEDETNYWCTKAGTLDRDGVTYYKWENPEYSHPNSNYTVYFISRTENPQVGDEWGYVSYVDGEFDEIVHRGEAIVLEIQYGGKGVIYYMKDEWNNEAPYDFKNILFTVDLMDRQEAATALWLADIFEADFYTFSYVDDETKDILDSTTLPLSYTNNDGYRSHTANNIVKDVSSNYASDLIRHELPGNIVADLSLPTDNNGFRNIHFDSFTFDNIVVLNWGGYNIVVGKGLEHKDIVAFENHEGNLIFESSSMKTIILD